MGGGPEGGVPIVARLRTVVSKIFILTFAMVFVRGVGYFGRAESEFGIESVLKL